jgi:uncharacterized repeat protein (TIGR01451 family)
VTIYEGDISQEDISGRFAWQWCYRVLASNAGGESDWSGVECTTVKPDPPTLYSISNDDADNDYVVSWSGDPGATSYTLEEDDNAGFTSPLVRYSGSASHYEVTGQSEGTWYYRVLASNEGGDSDWSNVVSTEANVPPASVAIEGPTMTLVQTAATFTATVSPGSTTLPATYTWEATDHPPTVQTGGTSDQATFTWISPGQKVVTVTVENDAGQARDVFNVQVDLLLNKTVSPEGPIAAGGVLEYAITYQNVGDIPVTGRTITDAVPAHTTFLDAQDGGVYQDGVVHWNLSQVAPGESGVLRFRTQVNRPLSTGTTVTNVATVNSAGQVVFETNRTTNTVSLMPDFGLSYKAQSASYPVGPRDLITYTIFYTNGGTLTAFGTVITDVLPAHISYHRGDCLHEGGVVRCDVGSVGVGGSGQCSFVVRLDQDAPVGAVISNQATIGSNQTPAVTTPPVTLTVTAPVLSLHKRVIPTGSVAPGTTLTYTLAYSNSGNVSAAGVVIRDPLPLGLVYLSGGSYDGEQVLWDVGTVQPGQGGEVTFSAWITDGVAVVYNQAHLSADDDISRSSNSVATPILMPVLQVRKTANPPEGVLTGGLITYTLAYTNAGEVSATGALILDPLPASLDHVSGGTYVAATRVVSFPLGTVLPGESDTLSFVSQALSPPGSVIVNAARAFNDQHYPATYQSDEPLQISGDLSFAPVGGSSGLDYVAQSFVATAPRLARVGLYLYGATAPYPATRLQLWGDTAGRPDPDRVLAVGDLISDVSAVGRRYAIAPHYPIDVVVGQRYWIVVDGSVDSVTSGSLGVKYASGTSYGDGTWYYSADGGGSWIESGGQISDLDTRVEYVSPPESNGVATIVIGTDSDAYEPDGACSYANVIPTDGTPQAHNFDDEADVDWAYFHAISGTTYIIETANPGPGTDTVLELHAQCEAPPLVVDDNAFGSGSRISWNCTETGIYYVKVYNNDSQIHGPEVSYSLSVDIDTNPPSPPEEVEAAAGDERIVLEWQPSSEFDVVGYRLYYGHSPGTYNHVVYIPGWDTAAYVLDGLSNMTRYYLALTAIDFGGHESDFSAEVTAVPPGGDLTAPDVLLHTPTSTSIYTTTQAVIVITGTCTDSGGNLNYVEVVNMTNEQRRWDHRLEGHHSAFVAGDIPLESGDNDLVITVYDTAGNYATTSLTIHRMEGQGVAIIVAGHNDPFAEQHRIYHVTNRAYRIFRQAGFSADNILYLSPTGQDADHDGDNDVDLYSLPSNLEIALTEWAPSRLGPDVPFFLYLMDHGNPDRFCADGCKSPGYVSAVDLDEWLTEMEALTGAGNVNVIIDACHSGSFIHYPDEVTASGRVVVASTAPSLLAYASTQGALFSDEFLSELEAGASLYEAFGEARRAVHTAVGMLQRPWLDDNGNATPNEFGEGAVADTRYLLAAFGGMRPVISETIALQRDDSLIDLSARVVPGGGRIETVWAALYPPSWEPPQANPGEIIGSGADLVELTDAGGGYLYSGEYVFDESGEYRVVFYAAEEDGDTAAPRSAYVRINYPAYLPLVLRVR